MKSREVAGLGTILGVWAHPDDEAYSAAGVMLLAREAGARVVSISATRGERGTPDPQRWPPARLAAVRERELVASLAALGVAEHAWLDLVDGTLGDVPAAGPVERLTDWIEQVRPDTILTFGPDGMTGHPDHQAVSAWVQAAVRGAGRRLRILHTRGTEGWAERFAALHARFDMFQPGYPVTVPKEDLTVHLELSGPALDAKVVALRAQASQTAALYAAVGEETFSAWVAEEGFVEG